MNFNALYTEKGLLQVASSVMRKKQDSTFHIFCSSSPMHYLLLLLPGIHDTDK